MKRAAVGTMVAALMVWGAPGMAFAQGVEPVVEPAAAPTIDSPPTDEVPVVAEVSPAQAPVAKEAAKTEVKAVAAKPKAPAANGAKGEAKPEVQGEDEFADVGDGSETDLSTLVEGDAVAAPAAAPGVAPEPGQPLPDTYVVEPGDTLWDLSQRFYNTPWYWPKVWAVNPEIDNPHWIYPGTTLRFHKGNDGAPTKIEVVPPEAEEGQVASEMPDDEGEVASLEQDEETDYVAVSQTAYSRSTPSSSRGKALFQTMLVTEHEFERAGVIKGSFEEKLLLTTTDRLYVRFPDQDSVKVGDQLSIFASRGEVTHPKSGKRYGYMTAVLGVAKVIEKKDKLATVIITRCNSEVSRGDFVGPLGAFDRNIAVKPNQAELEGVIVAAANKDLPELADQMLVFVDKGSADGVEEGNTFKVVRHGDPGTGSKDSEFPDEVIGALLVVDVREQISTAIVTRSVRELRRGERVVMVSSAEAGAPRAEAPTSR